MKMTLNLLNLAVELDVDDEYVADRLQTLLQQLRAPGPAHTSVALHGDEILHDGRVRDFGLASIPPELKIDRILFWLKTILLESVRSYLLLDAAAVAASDRALLLAAPPGSGKSTIATILIARGLQFLGDFASAIDCRSGYAYALPFPIELIDPPPPLSHQLRNQEPELPASVQYIRDGTTDAFRIIPHRVAIAARPAAVVLLHRASQADWELDPVAPDEALVSMSRLTLNASRLKESLGCTRQLVKSVPVFRLSLPSLRTPDDMDRLTGLLLSVLASQ